MTKQVIPDLKAAKKRLEKERLEFLKKKIDMEQIYKDWNAYEDMLKEDKSKHCFDEKDYLVKMDLKKKRKPCPK